MTEDRPRLAELIGSLSLATDLAAGLGAETALRTCLIAVAVGRVLGLTGEGLRDVYYTGLLRFLGCTAFAHETARRSGTGDDMAFLRALTPADTGSAVGLLRAVLGHVGRESGAGRLAAMARVMRDPGFGEQLARAHCSLAIVLARRLGMSEAVTVALGQMYERYDGKGVPNRLRGAAISPPARIMHVAFRAEAHRGLFGPEEAIAVVRARAGGELDPEVAAAFLKNAPEVLAGVGAASVWDAFLAVEPTPVVRVPTARLDEIAEAFAHYVDLKSPYTLGHSTAVARLAAAAGRRAGLTEEEWAALRIAGLLHDLGRASVPNGIWDKAGPLNQAEWERVRLHPYHSERILSQSALLRPYARLAGMHHERADGSGYHRGIAGGGFSHPARILAAADAYQAMTEDRPYRPAASPGEAAGILTAEARAGRHDREAVEAVLAAAGRRPGGRLRGAWPAALSEREVEVLCLLARGLTNKEIAARLVISPSTVKNHLAHIYQKTGVATRAAAAVFAVEHDLLEK